MNAAIASRVTGSFGQYSVADVQPSVTLRFFTHSTFGQKPAPAPVVVDVGEAGARCCDGGRARGRGGEREGTRVEETFHLQGDLRREVVRAVIVAPSARNQGSKPRRKAPGFLYLAQRACDLRRHLATHVRSRRTGGTPRLPHGRDDRNKKATDAAVALSRQARKRWVPYVLRRRREIERALQEQRHLRAGHRRVRTIVARRRRATEA